MVLDVGANVDTKAEHLRQFAVMGHFYAQEILGTPAPRIGLLSIGEEEAKGTDFTREVFKVLKATGLNFVGNVEGRDVFNGAVDVVVCDGFVGNVLLKSAESLARADRAHAARGAPAHVAHQARRPARASRRSRASSDRTDYAEYGAAPLLGVKGGCFIGHGRSNAKAIRNAMLRAVEFCAAELDTQDPRQDRRAARRRRAARVSRRPAAPQRGGLNGERSRPFVFPGQGSQKVGMGKAWAEALRRGARGLRRGRPRARLPLSRALLGGPGRRAAAHRQHPAGDPDRSRSPIYARARGAGSARLTWSPGTASASTRRWSPPARSRLADAVRLVRRRGELMQEAVPVGVGAMAAILGLDAEPGARQSPRRPPATQVCAVANYNCAGADGDRRPSRRRSNARSRLAQGARRASATLLLPVSAPFHSPLMAPARAGLAPLLAAVPLRDPRMPVVCNVDARRSSTAPTSRDALVRQIDGPVRWVESVELHARTSSASRRFVEVGPGRVLTGLVKRIVTDAASHLGAAIPRRCASCSRA